MRKRNRPTTTTRKKRKTKLCLPAAKPTRPRRRTLRSLAKRRIDINVEAIDFKTPTAEEIPHGKRPHPARRITGMTAKMHRKLTQEIKRARNVLLVK